MTEFVHLAGNKYAVHLYRNMIKSARRLPQPKRDDAMKSIREGFRLNAGVADAERKIELLHEAESKLGFLKIITPKNRVGNAGETTSVYRDGKIVDGAEARRRDKARHSNWSGNNLDPDSVRQHKRNLARAGFNNHSQVLGPEGF